MGSFLYPNPFFRLGLCSYLFIYILYFVLSARSLCLLLYKSLSLMKKQTEGGQTEKMVSRRPNYY